ncbi:hypothetical protein CMUS01_16707 [Colletotrichum musicola]|uniref:Uncharacterized protein n=1 Tax=Colletotrichum musicola TaxID=2175873 RepID=A0A8H6ILS3_9PEZI|nr:hypothetical protein CMUS01_16707 [Colletotrichum musicola]
MSSALLDAAYGAAQAIGSGAILTGLGGGSALKRFIGEKKTAEKKTEGVDSVAAESSLANQGNGGGPRENARNEMTTAYRK